MRLYQIGFGIVVCLSTTFLAGQSKPTGVTATARAVNLLQGSLNALSGTKSLADVTSNGSVRYISGSESETGSATGKAAIGGNARIDLSLSSGTRSEILNVTAQGASGAWSGPDGVWRDVAPHNLLTNPAWFFPAFAIAQGLSSSDYTLAYLGHETFNGSGVEHLSISKPSLAQLPTGMPTIGHLTQIDLFLDSVSLLPTGITFNIHPDNNAVIDIPVQVVFSDYRAVGSAQVPFHVQKFVAHSLTLDFQWSTVELNTGLSNAAFNLQ
jgi:hypothetical protein